MPSVYYSERTPQETHFPLTPAYSTQSSQPGLLQSRIEKQEQKNLNDTTKTDQDWAAYSLTDQTQIDNLRRAVESIVNSLIQPAERLNLPNITDIEDSIKISLAQLDSYAKEIRHNLTGFLVSFDIYDKELLDKYSYLGRWKGPSGKKEIQEKVKLFWKGVNNRDFSWFLEHLKTEHNAEVLDASVDIISERISKDAKSILQAFNESQNIDFHETLLKSYRWSPKKLEDSEADSLLKQLGGVLKSKDKDLREAAYRATRALPNDLAKHFLNLALEQESDSDNKAVIKDELWSYDHS